MVVGGGGNFSTLERMGESGGWFGCCHDERQPNRCLGDSSMVYSACS